MFSANIYGRIFKAMFTLGDKCFYKQKLNNGLIKCLSHTESCLFILVMESFAKF